MQAASRNTLVEGDWVLKKISSTSNAICQPFDCGDDDLNEYFHKDAILHRRELLTQTYYLHLSKYPFVALALLDFCNDVVQLKKYESVINIDLDPRKRYKNLPAVKLTRFGVLKDYQGMNIGSHTLNMVKKFFMTDNRTGCRFITVDAYNKPEVIHFYQKNNFELLTDLDKTKHSRSMYFDLKRLAI